MATSSTSAIRREIEASVEFRGSVDYIAAGPEHCCFTSGPLLYAWPIFAPQPLPPLELPFAPAAIAVHEDSLLAVSAEAVVVLSLSGGGGNSDHNHSAWARDADDDYDGDESEWQQRQKHEKHHHASGLAIMDVLLAPTAAALFPIASGAAFSRCGRRAVACSATSDAFIVVSGLGAFTNIENCLEGDDYDAFEAYERAQPFASSSSAGDDWGGGGQGRSAKVSACSYAIVGPHADDVGGDSSMTGSASSPLGGAIAHAVFSTSHLFLVSRGGRFAAVPIACLSSSRHSSSFQSTRDGDYDSLPPDTVRIPASSAILSPAGGLASIVRGSPLAAAAAARAVTSVAVDDSGRRLLVGLDDGALLVLGGLLAEDEEEDESITATAIGRGGAGRKRAAQQDPPPFSLLAIVDVRAPLVEKRAVARQQSVAAAAAGGQRLNVSVDASNVQCPLLSVVYSEVTPRATACIASPFGFAFIDVEGLCSAVHVGGTSAPEEPHIVHLALTAAEGDGVSPAAVVGGCGAALAWQAFGRGLTLSVFVPAEFAVGGDGGNNNEEDAQYDGDGLGDDPLPSRAYPPPPRHVIDPHRRASAAASSGSPMPIQTINVEETIVMDANDADDDEGTMAVIASILADSDRDERRMGWAGVMRSAPFASLRSCDGGGPTITAGGCPPRPPPLQNHPHQRTAGGGYYDYDAPERPLTAQGLCDDPSALADIINAKAPLGPRYTAPLALAPPPPTTATMAGVPRKTAAGSGGAAVRLMGGGRIGAPMAQTARGIGSANANAARPSQPNIAGGGGEKKKPATPSSPAVSATSGRPLQGSVTKPVTFGRPIKGSGYGAAANVPWSVQQEQKKKRAAAAAARAKQQGPTVRLGEERPVAGAVGGGGGVTTIAPAIVGGVPYVYDVAKSAAPIVPKVKSNEVMARPENKVHSGAIASLTYNAGATAIITGGSDATLHYLRCPISTHKGEGRGLRGHAAPVLSVDASLGLSGHPLVASSGRDGCVAVWAPTRREAPYIMENVAGPKDVSAVKFFYHDKLLVAAVGPQIKFFRYAIDYGGGDLDRGRNLSRLAVADQYRTDAQSVTALDCANSLASTVVAWSGSNKQFGVVDIGAQRTVRRTEEAHTRPIHSVVLAAAAARFASPAVGSNVLHCCATAAVDKTVKLWDLRAAAPCRVFSQHANFSQQVGLCFSPCGTFVVVGSEDRAAFVYDTRGGSGGYGDSFAASSTYGGDSSAGSCVARITMPDVVTACRYHPLEPVVALGTAGGDIRLFGA